MAEHIQPQERERTSREAPDAIRLLQMQHQEVISLFEQYSEAEGDEKKDIANRISDRLIVHAEIEEAIFYPAVQKEGKKARDMVEHSLEEHAETKELLSSLSNLSYLSPDFAEDMQELQSAIEDHVEEEENEMFPLVRKELSNLDELGQQMAGLAAKTNPARVRNRWEESGKIQ